MAQPKVPVDPLKEWIEVEQRVEEPFPLDDLAIWLEEPEVRDKLIKDFLERRSPKLH